MPWTQSYHAPSDTFITHGIGEVSDADIVAWVKKRCCHPHYHAGVRLFFDYANVDKFEVTQRIVDELPKIDPVYPNLGKKVFLMFSPHGTSAYEQHMRKVLTDNVRIFCNRRDAVAWLNEGVPPDRVLAVEDTLPDDQRPHWKG